MRGLYVHIPFCVSKCSYCDFYSLPARQDMVESYLHAVLLEAESYTDCHSESFRRRAKNLVPPTTSSNELLSHEMGESRVRGDSLLRHSDVTKSEKNLVSGPTFQTLYIGGGTPSLLGPKNLTTLITGLPCHSERSEESSSPNSHCAPSAKDVGSGFGSLSNFARNGEILSTAAEMYDRPNPIAQDESGQTSLLCKERLRENYFKVSSGGTLIESTIELNPESATPEFLQTVKNLGFTRLSFGVQSLNDNELKSVGRIHTAKQAVTAIKLAQKLEFKAISADLIIGLPGQTSASLRKSLETLVELGIQHLSVYCLSLEANTPLANNPPPDLPTDDMQATLFEETRNYLITRGFAHYEISNFALPGYQCLHNLNYWRGGEYLGLGPAAASHLDGKRFKNSANLDAYLQNPIGQIEDIEELSAKDKAAEEAMLRLRLLEEGLDADVLTERFGQENAHDIFTRLDKMVQECLLIHEGSKYRLTPSRILTSNPIFARVLGDNGE